MNISSTSSYKSPGVKDYGISERLEAGREKIVSGYERWKTAEKNGFHILNIIHGLNEKTKNTEHSQYPQELENYCSKLRLIQRTFEDVIKSIETFKKEISGSQNVLNSFRDDNEDLRSRLDDIAKFLSLLLNFMATNLEKKVHVIGESLQE